MRRAWTVAAGLFAVALAGVHGGRRLRIADDRRRDDDSGAGAETPHVGSRTVGATWDLQLSGAVDTSVDAAVYDIDGSDNSGAVVAALHAAGRRAVCYVDAGSWEDWRADAGRFPASVRGNALDGWPGERWLDIRRIDTLKPLMADRFDTCKAKGFDGVDPDNVDGYNNSTGFPLSAADQIAYNKMLAGLAHDRGLAIGLKNDLDQVAALVRIVRLRRERGVLSVRRVQRARTVHLGRQARLSRGVQRPDDGILSGDDGARVLVDPQEAVARRLASSPVEDPRAESGTPASGDRDGRCQNLGGTTHERPLRADGDEDPDAGADREPGGRIREREADPEIHAARGDGDQECPADAVPRVLEVGRHGEPTEEDEATLELEHRQQVLSVVDEHGRDDARQRQAGREVAGHGEHHAAGHGTRTGVVDRPAGAVASSVSRRNQSVRMIAAATSAPAPAGTRAAASIQPFGRKWVTEKTIMRPSDAPMIMDGKTSRHATGALRWVLRFRIRLCLTTRSTAAAARVAATTGRTRSGGTSAYRAHVVAPKPMT